MNDPHYPDVDIEFLVQLISQSEKVEHICKSGKSTGYVLKGNQPIGNRLIIIRETKSNKVDYIFATGTAMRLKCMGELLKWLEENRNWKDGAYFV